MNKTAVSHSARMAAASARWSPRAGVFEQQGRFPFALKARFLFSAKDRLVLYQAIPQQCAGSANAATETGVGTTDGNVIFQKIF